MHSQLTPFGKMLRNGSLKFVGVAAVYFVAATAFGEIRRSVGSAFGGWWHDLGSSSTITGYVPPTYLPQNTSPTVLSIPLKRPTIPRMPLMPATPPAYDFPHVNGYAPSNGWSAPMPWPTGQRFSYFPSRSFDQGVSYGAYEPHEDFGGQQPILVASALKPPARLPEMHRIPTTAPYMTDREPQEKRAHESSHAPSAPPAANIPPIHVVASPPVKPPVQSIRPKDEKPTTQPATPAKSPEPERHKPPVEKQHVAAPAAPVPSSNQKKEEPKNPAIVPRSPPEHHDVKQRPPERHQSKHYKHK